MSNVKHNPNFAHLIEGIARRPAMYVGKASLWSIGLYLAGYCDGLEQFGLSSNEFRGFTVWLSEKFLIFHSAWHWTRIVLHTHENDEAAIQALPALYSEYLETKRGKTLAQLEIDRDEALLAAYGKTWSEPDSTYTRPFGETAQQHVGLERR